MLLIADALTVMYLRPYLIATGFEESEVNRIVVWYDPTAIATRNDRATDADAGFDRMAVSANSWRRAHGFSDADAPTPKEIALRLLQERGVLTPEFTEAMLSAVAPEVINTVRSQQQQSSVAPIPPELQEALDAASQGAEAAGIRSEAPAEGQEQ